MPNIMCKHVVKGLGCGIYKERPLSCASFQCVWLLRENLPEELKPNKCHAVIASYEEQPNMVSVYVDPGYPQAHKEGLLAWTIDELIKQRVLVLVAVGSKVYHRLGKQWVEALVVRDPSNPFSGKIDVFNVGDGNGKG